MDPKSIASANSAIPAIDRLFAVLSAYRRTFYKKSFIRSVATGDCVRTRQNAAFFVLFVEFSLEVRQVRLRSPSPKFIENNDVLVADKSCIVFLG